MSLRLIFGVSCTPPLLCVLFCGTHKQHPCCLTPHRWLFMLFQGFVVLLRAVRALILEFLGCLLIKWVFGARGVLRLSTKIGCFNYLSYIRLC